MRSYYDAYNFFFERNWTLPRGKDGEADEALDKFFYEQFAHNPNPGHLSKMNQILFMIDILHPGIFVNIHMAKLTLKQWKMTHKPQSATAINSIMAQAFASYLGA